MTTLVWFRNDLRLSDNPAIVAAVEKGAILPVFVLEDPAATGETHPMGGASRWWLHHALMALEKDLGGLVLLRGDARHVIPDLARRVGATGVYWNRAYEPHAIERDSDIKAALKGEGLDARSFKANLLVEPFEIETKAGGSFKVYSPFWRAVQGLTFDAPLARPETIRLADFDGGETLEDLGLLPVSPNWAEGWEDIWIPGEAGAHARLSAFLEEGMDGYGDKRNRPDLPNVSRLSPHLHFGEISPRQIWHAVREGDHGKDGEKFLSELAWREFSYHLLYHFPKLPESNWREDFNAYPWAFSEANLTAWQRGRTGYPIVDAGMRELWATGYMHNRVRMIVASFLVKHLRIHWHHGEEWFRDTLVDADLANNSASWQWVTGSGADAAPYFRIFNPITQGQKFDPDGVYVRRWVPELSKVPDQYLNAPFDAPESVLKKAGVVLGKDYPKPIVDHATARQKALDGYDAVKSRREEREGEAAA